MDYRITDSFADPADAPTPGTETLWRLPHVAWCYNPPAAEHAPEVAPPPSAANGVITFGSVNNLAKVTDAMGRLWAKLLDNTPGSRLLLLDAFGHGGEDVIARFVAYGIQREQLVVMPRQPRQKYFELFAQIDIALDPFPYNGGVTTCDTLWMGVPVITRAGQSYASRQGVSLLSNLGLPELIARSDEDYIAIATSLAHDPIQLAGMRTSLREKMKRSPICDAARFVSDLAEAYRRMWRQWCLRGAGDAPTKVGG